jgi:hypothetical protein
LEKWLASQTPTPPPIAIAAEISRLIPASGAAFCAFGDGMRHQPADRKHNQCSRNLGNKKHCHQKGDGVLVERKKRKNHQRCRRCAESNKYQRRAVKVRSATGPQRNRQRFADTPMATIDAASATENPTRVRMNGKVMETNPC